jgi:hypothetical protein
VQWRALAILFSVLATFFAAVAVYAVVGAGDHAARWIVAVAAVAIAGWFASLALSALRR